ncbi:bestrophin family ion channel [Paludisphaera sp.]|uniref:bestrophin family protein n=1 Tax=Paludisphaera sp. TaxID=2017432 RepID=UPI00301E3E72
MRSRDKELLFWVEVFGVQGSAVPLILLRVLIFGAFAALVTLIDDAAHGMSLHVGVGPHEVAGAALGLLLVLRTNAGYDRWWEGRKLWGGIVNQTRNLGIQALAYGPEDREWREQVIRWTAALPHAIRLGLRDQRASTSVTALLGREAADHLFASHHMSNAVCLRIGGLLRRAREEMGMDGFAFTRAEEQRAVLIDHMGACERIRSSPLPVAYRIEIRRFILFFLVTLPFALVGEIHWLTPLVTMLVAAPILALDKIGTELQFPFTATSLNALPLDQLCLKIETDLLAMLDAGDPLPPAAPDRRGGSVAEGSRQALGRATAT